jgi:hypothetical protein
MEELDQATFCCKFNRVNGDIRYCAHIYNIAVQAGKLEYLYSSKYTKKKTALKAIKAEPAESRSHYHQKTNEAFLPNN